MKTSVISTPLGCAWQDEDSKFKWPKARKRVVPTDYERLTLKEAFAAWPRAVVRFCKNMRLDIMQEKPDMPPLIAGKTTLTIASHFSGVCTQSRAAAILHAHDIGVKFKHVAWLQSRDIKFDVMCCPCSLRSSGMSLYKSMR